MSTSGIGAIIEYAATAQSALWMLALKSATVLGAATVLTLFMHRRSASARHLVWSLALSAALVLPILSTVVPAWNVALLPRMEPADASVASPVLSGGVPSAAAVAVAIPEPGAAPAGGDLAASASASAVAPAATVSFAPIVAAGSAPDPELLETPSARWMGLWRASLAPWSAVRLALVLVWPLGTLLLLARAAVAIAAMTRLVRRATPVETDGALRHRLGDALLRCTVRDAELRVSDEVDVPVTWGLTHPIVLLPSEAAEWTTERRTLVLEHELAHVVRRDVWMHLVARVTRSLYWPNPLAWFAERELRLESEQACDDAVLARGVRPTRYAEELLEIARTLAPAGAPRLAPSFASRPRIERRLRALLDGRLPRRIISRRDAGAGALGVLALMIPLAAIRPIARNTADPLETMEPVRAPFLAAASPAPAADPAPEVMIAVTELPAPVIARVAAAAAATTTATITGVSTASTVRIAGVGIGAGTGRGAASRPALATASEISRGEAWQEPGTCVADGHSSSNMTNEDNGVRRWEVHWTGRDCGVDLRAQGKVDFADDLTDLRSISPGGWFDLSIREGDRLTRLYVKPGTDGALERRLTIDGAEQPWNAEARQWLGRFLVELDRRTAFAVDTRLPKLLARGGVDAVLDEIGHMSGDYARGVYFQKLLTARTLDAGQVRRVIDLAGDIGSDYTLAQVLVAVANRYGLPDASTREAFLRSLDHIKSDYERSRTLHALLDRSHPSEAEAGAILASASKLQSDYELARTLVDLVGRKLVSPPLFDTYLEDAARIQSSYERSRVLRTLLAAGTLTDAQVGRVVSAATGIESDNERANVLVAIAGAYDLKGDVRSKYEQAAEAIGSDYERGRAMAALNRTSGRRTF